MIVQKSIKNTGEEVANSCPVCRIQIAVVLWLKTNQSSNNGCNSALEPNKILTPKRQPLPLRCGVMAVAAEFYRLKLLLPPNPRSNSTALAPRCPLNLSRIESLFHHRNCLFTRKFGLLHQKRRRGFGGVRCQVTGIQPKRAPSDAEIELAARAGKDRLSKVYFRSLLQFLREKSFYF